MTDLTKIDRPFGLLDEATQKALRECGGPWEFFSFHGAWTVVNNIGGEGPHWHKDRVYRQKPQPPKPREVVLFEYEDGTFSSAPLSYHGDRISISKWREVIE